MRALLLDSSIPIATPTFSWDHPNCSRSSLIRLPTIELEWGSWPTMSHRRDMTHNCRHDIRYIKTVRMQDARKTQAT